MKGLCLMCSKSPASERVLEYRQDAITFHLLSQSTHDGCGTERIRAPQPETSNRIRVVHDKNPLSRYHDAVEKLTYQNHIHMLAN
jgi:hypothetical protein